MNFKKWALTGSAVAMSLALVGCGQSNSNTETTQTTTTTETKTTGELKTEQKDIAYASVSEAQKFDIYLPNTDGNLPVVLNIHGGAFMLGDKAGMQMGGGLGGGRGNGGQSTTTQSSSSTETVAAGASQTAILGRGYAYATMNYRLSGEAVFPAAINDVKACIRYLKAHAAELGINPDKIYLYGQSAGGNLAALAGVSGEINSFDDEKLGNETYDSKVAGVIDFYGPINFLTMDSDFAELGVTDNNVTNVETSPESKYMGALISTVPDKVAKSNPETYITKDDPKFFIQAGSEDKNIPYIQGQKFAEKLNSTNPNSATWTLLEGEGHGTAGFESEENLNKMLDWLDSIAK